VAHWKSGHYAAVLKEDHGFYLVHDPTFGRVVHFTLDAIDDESDGYFLVPEGALPKGWQPVGSDVAKTVWGRGQVPQRVGGASGTDQPKIGGSCHAGMASYSVLAMLLSLSLSDTPLFYNPPVGPGISFEVTVNQLEANQPATFTYSNLGPLAVHNWMAFVTAPATVGQTAYVNTRGGGQETYNSYTAASTPPNYVGSYAAEPQSNATLWVTSTGNYERHLPDGSNEIYSTPDGTGRIFLNQFVDPQGNPVTLTYDSSFRIVAITDAIGQVTTLTYGLAADPLKITRVTDPFGRFATFGYSAATPYVLTSITDEIGITSQFTYTTGNILASLVTPYGTTTFVQSLTNTSDISLQITDPKGQTECFMSSLDGAVGIAASESSIPSGYGLNIMNQYLQYRNTYYWNKITVAAYGTLTSNNLGNAYYNIAHIYHWLHTSDGASCSPVLESEKKPLESRIWYNYPGQPNAIYEGSSANPTIAARLLDDGTTQAFRYSYNAIGKITQSIDPIGRTFTNSYYQNGVDLNQTTQTRNGANELLATYTWNTQHRPLTFTDAAGQLTQYAWNALGQLTSITNAKSETTTFSYYTANATGKQRAQRLSQIVGALPGGTQVTTFDYDAYGNVASITGPDGYNLQFTYDALSRPLTVTYPDGTFEQTTYQLLDPATRRDRLGRNTTYVYDSIRQLLSVTDPANRTVQYTWCKCGALSQLIDPMNRVTIWKHDIEGRTTSKKYVDGSAINYAYGTNSGRLSSITDEKQQVKTYAYNLDDTLVSTTYTNTQVATPAVSFVYDPNYRRVTTMTDGTGSTNYAYNPIAVGTNGAGQLASETGPLANSTIAYTYDVLGRRTAYTVNGVGETRNLDQAGRVTSVVNPLGTFGYNYVGATGRLNNITCPNGLTCSYDYQPLSGNFRLKDIINTLPGNAFLSQHSYIFDASGNITRWTQTTSGNAINRSWLCGYDGANQLTSVASQDPTTFANQATGQYAYTYDPAGNRLTQTLDGSTTTGNYNALNQLGTLTNGGTSVLPLRTYEWDAENRLRAINYTATNQRSQFTYDGIGRRVEILELTNGVVQSDTKYVWCGPAICEARDSTGANVLRRMFERGEVFIGSPNTSYYYTNDHLGSVREIVDNNGVLRSRYDYDPYGNKIAIQESFQSSYGYTGIFAHQPSGLWLTWFRALESTSGRWLSRDPFGENGGFNLYGYAGNDPANLSDRLGLWFGVDDAFFAGGGLLVGVGGRFVGDLVSFHWSTTEEYVGAAIGGAVSGETLLYTANPFIAGAAGGLAGNLTTQGLNYLTGKQCGFNVGSAAFDTAFGAATGFIPGRPRFPGINAGQGSDLQVFRQIVTKASNGTISGVSTLTAAKMANGAFFGYAFGQGAAAGAIGSNVYNWIFQ